MRRWMFIFPALLLFGLAMLMRDSEVAVGVGVIGGLVCMAAGGFTSPAGGEG